MWSIPDTFIAQPLPQASPKPWKPADANPWGEPKSVIPPPVINDADQKKRLFAVELSRTNDPFKAACNICGQNTQEALWISKNWINDIQVIGYRDGYLNSLETSKSLLDKEELAAKFLNMAEEKSSNGLFYQLEGKDRLRALELYAKVQGYLDTKEKPTQNFIHNSMVVKFVKPNTKEEKIIDHSNTGDDKHINDGIVPLKVKLVSSG